MKRKPNFYSLLNECLFVADEISAVLKLDNVTMGQTSWKPCSQQAWDQRFSFTLEKSRELEIAVYWRDWRSLCAVKFLRLEEFVDDVRHGMALQLEPQGMLFAEASHPNINRLIFSVLAHVVAGPEYPRACIVFFTSKLKSKLTKVCFLQNWLSF